MALRNARVSSVESSIATPFCNDEIPQPHQTIDRRVHRFEVTVEDFSDDPSIADLRSASVIGTKNLSEARAVKARVTA